MRCTVLGPLALVAVSLFPSQASADDSCVACGRLIIEMVGAGEIPNNNPYESDTAEYGKFDPLRNDSLEYDAINHLKQFSRLPDGKLPVRIILITSDSSLKERAESLARLSKSPLSVLPNSIDSFKHFAESADSELASAFKAFAANPTCRDLMRKRHSESISSVIKIDILIVGEFARSQDLESGIPTWSSSDRKGTASDWIRDGSNVLNQKLWKGLTDKFRDSITQVFFGACKSGRTASLFEDYFDDNASCFVASTNQAQNDYGGAGVRATFTYAIKDPQQFKAASVNTWSGARSIVEMLPNLYLKYEGMIFPKAGDKADPYQFVEDTNRRNPLVGFIYTSADALAEEALKKLGGISDYTAFLEHPAGLQRAEVKALSESKKYEENASGAFWAQATDELPEITAESVLSDDWSRVIEQVEAIRRSFSTILSEDDGLAKAISAYEKQDDLFADCMFRSERQSQQCRDLDNYFTSVFENRTPSKKLLGLRISHNAFVRSINENKPLGALRAYKAREISRGEFFERLHNVRMAYLNLAKDFRSAVKDSREAERVKETVEPAFNEMTNHFEAAVAALKEPMFKAFRKDAIQLKLDKIEIATKLVALHADALPRGYAEEFPKRMSRKLDCLMKVPVGPMFDSMATVKSQHQKEPHE